MNNEKYNQIVDEVYRKYADSHEYFVDGYLHVIPMVHNKETFVNACKTDSKFSERWGLKIEERELSLEERLCITDKFNPLIREDCLTKTHHPDEAEELKLQYRHEWLDSLGPNVVPQRRAITLTYNNETVEVYE